MELSVAILLNSKLKDQILIRFKTISNFVYLIEFE